MGVGYGDTSTQPSEYCREMPSQAPGTLSRPGQVHLGVTGTSKTRGSARHTLLISGVFEDGRGGQDERTQGSVTSRKERQLPGREEGKASGMAGYIGLWLLLMVPPSPL